MKKFIDNINNNIDTISSSFNKLKERRNEDSANLSFLDPSDSHLEEKKPSIGANSDIKVVKKLKRRNLQVEPASIPTAKPETKPEEKKPSLKEMASAGMKENAQKQTKPRKVVVPIQRVREEVSLLMEYWGELGFHLPSEKANGAYNNNVRSLEKIMKGTLIPSEKRKFTPEDIRISMCRLKQIVFDKEYGPSQVIKDILSKIDLNAFLYNPYAKTTSSWFLVCLKEEPKKNFDPSIAEDKHPIITNRLRSFYFKYALAGMKSNLTPREESKFREGANKLCEIYDRYRQRFAGINGYTEFSDIFCQAMKHSYGNKTTMIHPSTFNTSNSRATMIAFMNEMGYIPDADFQVDF